MIKYHVPFMDLAIAQAKKANQLGEIPIGAILVDKQNNILSTAYNQTVGMSDPTAHAEILALRAGGNKLGNYRLLNTTLYVTIEPCLMCMGAIVHARVYRVVFGARDPKWGAVGSLYNFAKDDRLNHRVDVVSGICETACAHLIQRFFQQKREQSP